MRTRPEHLGTSAASASAPRSPAAAPGLPQQLTGSPPLHRPVAFHGGYDHVGGHNPKAVSPKKPRSDGARSSETLGLSGRKNIALIKLWTPMDWFYHA